MRSATVFKTGMFSYAAAVSMFKSVVAFIPVVVTVNKIAKKWEKHICSDRAVRKGGLLKWALHRAAGARGRHEAAAPHAGTNPGEYRCLRLFTVLVRDHIFSVLAYFHAFAERRGGPGAMGNSCCGRIRSAWRVIRPFCGCGNFEFTGRDAEPHPDRRAAHAGLCFDGGVRAEQAGACGLARDQPVFVFTMYFQRGLIPTYMVIRSLHLIDNFWVFIFPGMVNIFWVILVRTYMEGLPKRWRKRRRWRAQTIYRYFCASSCPCACRFGHRDAVFRHQPLERLVRLVYFTPTSPR